MKSTIHFLMNSKDFKYLCSPRGRMNLLNKPSGYNLSKNASNVERKSKYICFKHAHYSGEFFSQKDLMTIFIEDELLDLKLGKRKVCIWGDQSYLSNGRLDRADQSLSGRNWQNGPILYSVEPNQTREPVLHRMVLLNLWSSHSQQDNKQHKIKLYVIFAARVFLSKAEIIYQYVLSNYFSESFKK